jgi:hypothetical protein
MPKKLRDEIKSLTSGVATTGLEYVKHRKKKLRGGIIPLIVMGLQTGFMELANWAINEDERKQREAEEAAYQRYLERETKKAEAQALSEAGRDYAEQARQFQTQYGSQYRQQLADAVAQAKREEQQYLEQQDAYRRMSDRAMTQRQLQEYEAEQMGQNLRGQQQANLTRQRAMEDTRTAQQRQAAALQSQMAGRQLASSQVYTAELQQRLRQTQAEAQARQQQTQRRRVAAPVSTAQRIRTRR